MDAEPPFTSTGAIGIGEAARRVGLAPSAVRYYEREGLLDAAPRRDGRRAYGPEDLRRLAFIAMGRELGLGLAAIRDALHPGSAGWPAVVDRQVAMLDAQIARAQRARTMLLGARDCPEPEPVRDCPRLRAELDAVVAGVLTPPVRSSGGHVGAGS
ncbi:MAG: MerR family transcriptional regulator [Pseudonocardia sp.]